MRDNNFWSNADRIEIEYDYIGVFDPITSRKNIFTATPHTAAAKDSIVSFGTDMAADLKECKVHFLPKQDLHGYDKPWIGGTGKNILDVSNKKNGYYLKDTGEETANANFGYTTSYTPVTPNATYTLSRNVGNHGAAYSDIYCYDENKNFIRRLGAFYTNTLPHTFTVPEDTYYVNIQYFINDKYLQNTQLELGSTATAYEPYSNICPIEGWDEITVWKNIGEDIYTYDVIPANTSKVSVVKINDNSFRVYTTSKVAYPSSKQYSSSLNLVIGKKYLIDCDINFNLLEDGHVCSWGFRGSNNSYITGGTRIANITKSGHYSFSFIFGNKTQQYYLSLCDVTNDNTCNFDATVSNLKIYEVEEFAITFPQTIYGGYVDLVKGEVVEEYARVVGWTQYKQNNGFIAYRADTSNYKNNNWLCNMIGERGSFNTSNMTKNIIQDARVGIYNYLALDETENINDLVVVLPLVTPNIYSLTPQQITTLRGANTIWSNSNDDTEIKYWKHGDDAYQHVPSSPITSNDNFIIVTDDGYAIGEEDDFIVY